MEENAIGMPDSFFERLNKKNGFADDTTAAPVDSGTTPVATDKTIPSGMPDSFFEKLNSQQHYADTNNWAENYKRYIPQAEENPSAWDNIKNNFFAIKDASEASMYGGLELMSRQGEKSGNANFANFIKAAGMYYGADPNWLVKNMQENEAQSQEELKRVWLDPKMGQFNATDMFADPKSFFQTQLPQMLGGSATLMAAGMGIAKGVQTGVMALGAAGAPFTFGGSAVAAGFIGGAVASAISRPIESLMEGYGAFDEAYSELAKKYPNATHQQLTDMAMPVFNKTFDENMQLQVLDAVQLGLSIIPVTAWGKGALSGTGAIGRMARRADMMRQRYNVAAHIGETAFQMGTEGWEEGRQMQITNEAINKYVGTDKPTSWYDMLNTKEGQSAVSGGAFMGGMMESPGILKLAYNKLTGVGDDIKTKPYEDIKQKQTALFYGNIAKSVNEGTTNEMMQAINKFGRSGVLATVETDDADSRNKSSIAEAKRLGDEVAEQVGVFSRMKEQYPDVSEKGLVRMFQNNALIRNNANALKTLSEDNVTDAPIIQRINAQNEALNKENNDIIAGKDVWETPSHEDPFADPEKDKEADIPFDSVEEVEAARLKEIEALQQIPTDGMTDEQMYQRAESLAEINSRYEDLKNRLTEKINDAKGHYENQRVLTEMLQNNIPVEGTIQKAYGMHYDFVTQDGKTVRFYNQATHDVVDDNDFNGSAFLVLRKAEQGLDGTYKDEKGNYLFRSVLGDKDHAERIEVHTTDKDGNDKYLGNVAVSNAEDYNIARDRAKAARMEKLEGEDGEGEGFSVSDEQLSGVKTTSNEQAAEAQSYGFRNAYHALNSVNKYFDADYTDYANIPKEDLALVGRIKQEEAASATTTTPPPDSPPDSPPPSEPDTPPAPPTPPPTPPPAPQSPSPASAPSGTTSSTDSGNAGYERTERSFDKVNVGDNITHNGKQGKVFAKVRPKGSLSHPVVLAKDAEGVVFRVSESEYKGTERGESDNVLKTNGKLLSYRNDIGRIVVDEENNVIFEGNKSSVELGKTTDEEFAAKSIGDIGISYVNENSLDQAILVDNTVYIKGEQQELVRINYDKNDNVVSYTYKNSKGHERTNRNSETALDIAIQKNNQEFDKSRKGVSDEVKQRDEEHISGVVKSEYGDSIGYILETMPDEVYDTFDLMESGVTSLEKDAIQYMVLRTIEALADARKRIEGSNATKKEKGSALSMIEKFEKDLNKYYGKLDQQGKVSAKDVAKANTGENNKGVNTVQDAEQKTEAYHADKAAGKETELVKAVEDLINKNESNRNTTTEVNPKAGVSSNSNEGNSALRAAESTAKALEGVDTQSLKKQLDIEANWDMIGEGDALSGKDAVLAYTQKRLPEWNRESQLGNINPNSKLTYDIVRGQYGGLDQKNIAEAKDENGVTIAIAKLDDKGGVEHIAVAPEFRGKGVADDLIKVLKENNPNLDLSKTKLRSKGFEKAFGNKIISEAYHKAKADGSNPELVKAVEDLLAPKVAPTTNTEGETQTTEAQLQEFGVPEQDVKPVTNVLTAMVDGLRKAGLTAAKTVGDWVGIGKGEEKTYSLKINGKDTEVRSVSPEVVNGFYSPLEKIINESKQDKMPVKQWAEKYANSEEAKWTGLKEWLGQQQGSVSKAEIQQFLKDNRIQVVEVVKGEVSNFTKDDIADVKTNQHGAGNWVVKTKEDGTVEFPLDKADDKAEAIEYALEQLNYDNKSKRESKPKFQQYQLEGEKENYREVLVTMPNDTKGYYALRKEFSDYSANKVPRKSGEDIVAYQDRYKKELENDKDYQALRQRMIDADKKQKEDFKSSHFDEPNILVHLRINTRTDSEGSKVLFLEEVQSDWGQKGKKEGFVGDKQKELFNQFKYELLEVNGKQLHTYSSADGETVVSSSENKENARKNAEEVARKNAEFLYTREVPTAPFVTDTNAWTKLGLKVALKEAVKQGADKIAWSTGTQQFDRWGSEEIKWEKNNDKVKIENGKIIVNGKETGTIKKSKFEGDFIVEDNKTGERYVVKSEDEILNKGRGFSLLINEQTTGATAFNGQVAGNRDSLTVQTKEELRNAIKKNLSRERNESEINKLTDRIWDRMQKEDTGTSLPRKEGMEAFYGNPKEDKLGIVGQVAESLFGKGSVKTNELTSAKWKEEDGRNIFEDADGKYIGDYSKLRNGDYRAVNMFGKELLTKSESEAKKFIDSSTDFQKSTQHSIDITPELKAKVEAEGQPLFKDAEAQYRIESGNNIIEAIKDFNKAKNKSRATVALTHEIMHPTVVSIIDGAKEGNAVGQKHTKTIVEEYNKANPNNKVTEQELIADNDKFVNGETTDKYRAVQEFIAEQWERYHQEGAKGFSEAFQKVLDQITKAFQSVYKSLTGEQLTPELRKMFDDILGKEELSTDETTPTKEVSSEGNPALRDVESTAKALEGVDSNFTADLSDSKLSIDEKKKNAQKQIKDNQVTNDAAYSLISRALEKVGGLSVNNIFDLAKKISNLDNKPILVEHIAEAIQYEVGRVEGEKDTFSLSIDDAKDVLLNWSKDAEPANKTRMDEIGIVGKSYRDRINKLKVAKKQYELLDDKGKAIIKTFLNRYNDTILEDAKLNTDEYLQILLDITKSKGLISIAENIQNAVRIIEDKEAAELQKLPPVKDPLKNKENTEEALRRFSSQQLSEISIYNRDVIVKMIDAQLKKAKQALLNTAFPEIYDLPSKTSSMRLNEKGEVELLDKNEKKISGKKITKDQFVDIAIQIGNKQTRKDASSISEAYHKAKKDGTNPELVKAVEQSLKEQPQAGSVGVGGDVEATAKTITEKLSKQQDNLIQSVYDKYEGEEASKKIEELFASKEYKDIEEQINQLNPGGADLSGFEKTLSERDAEDYSKYREIGYRLVAADKKNGYKPFKVTESEKKQYAELRKRFDSMFADYSKNVDAENAKTKLKAVEQSLKEQPQAGSVGVGGENPALKDVESTTKALDLKPDFVKDEFPINKDYPTTIKKIFNKDSELVWIFDGKESYSPKSKEGKRLQALLLDPLTHNAPKDAKYIHLHDRKVQAGTTFRLKEATSKGISEAYHKAKADGSNPELVKAVEELLDKPKETSPTPNSKGEGTAVKYQIEESRDEPLSSVNPALAEYIRQRMQRLFPSVALFSDKASFEAAAKKVSKGVTFSSAYIGAAIKNLVYVDAEKALQHTEIHEYAHIYWDALPADHPLKTALLDKFGGNEEAAIDAIGRAGTIIMENELDIAKSGFFEKWLKKFWAAVKGVFTSKSIEQAFADRLLTNADEVTEENITSGVVKYMKMKSSAKYSELSEKAVKGIEKIIGKKISSLTFPEYYKHISTEIKPNDFKQWKMLSPQKFLEKMYGIVSPVSTLSPSNKAVFMKQYREYLDDYNWAENNVWTRFASGSMTLTVKEIEDLYMEAYKRKSYGTKDAVNFLADLYSKAVMYKNMQQEIKGDTFNKPFAKMSFDMMSGHEITDLSGSEFVSGKYSLLSPDRVKETILQGREKLYREVQRNATIKEDALKNDFDAIWKKVKDLKSDLHKIVDKTGKYFIDRNSSAYKALRGGTAADRALADLLDMHYKYESAYGGLSMEKGKYRVPVARMDFGGLAKKFGFKEGMRRYFAKPSKYDNVIIDVRSLGLSKPLMTLKQARQEMVKGSNAIYPFQMLKLTKKVDALTKEAYKQFNSGRHANGDIVTTEDLSGSRYGVSFVKDDESSEDLKVSMMLYHYANIENESYDLLSPYSMYIQKYLGRKDKPNMLKWVKMLDDDLIKGESPTSNLGVYAKYVQALTNYTHWLQLGFNIAGMPFNAFAGFAQSVREIGFRNTLRGLRRVIGSLTVGGGAGVVNAKAISIMEKLHIVSLSKDLEMSVTSKIGKGISKIAFLPVSFVEYINHAYSFIGAMDDAEWERLKALPANASAEDYTKAMGGNERVDELHTLTQKINGAYSKYSRRGINKTAEGRALMQFKNWLPDVIFAHLTVSQLNEAGEDLYGEYQSGIATSIKNTVWNKTIIPMFKDKSIAQAKKNWETLSEHEQMQVGKAMRQLVILGGMALWIASLDDRDDKELKRMLKRAMGDVTYIFDVSNMQFLFDNTVPVFGTIKNLLGLVAEVFSTATGNPSVYEKRQGSHKRGDLKLPVMIENQAPVVNKISKLVNEKD